MSYLRCPSCTIPSGKAKQQESSHQGVEEVMRRKMLGLQLSCGPVEQLQTRMKPSGAKVETPAGSSRVLCITTHTYLWLCLQRVRRLFSSNSTMSCQCHFAQQRILSETLLLFLCPCPLNSELVSSHRNCATHRHAASKEFVQPGKVALCGFALKVSADISLSGSYKLSTQEDDLG